MTKPMLLGVADALIISQSGLQMYSATLSSHTIDQTVDSTDLRGGRANKLIGRLKTSKNLSVTVEDLQQTKEMQALLSGSKIEAGSFTAYSMPKELSYVTGGIVLDGQGLVIPNPTPAEPDKVPCYDAKTGELLDTEWELATTTLKVGKKVGGALTELAQGTEFILGGYKYEAPATQYFKINGTKFAENVTVVLEEDVYDGETMQIIGVKQTIIPVATPDENFSLSGSREISETTTSYTFTALSSGACSDLGYVVYLPYIAPAC